MKKYIRPEFLKEGDTVYYTKKQTNDFNAFMSGFGGNNRGGSMPGGSGSGRPSGSGSSRPSGSGRNGGQP